MDTSKELSATNEVNLKEKDDIAENYGNDDSEIFKQTIYSKKSECLFFSAPTFLLTFSKEILKYLWFPFVCLSICENYLSGKCS